MRSLSSTLLAAQRGVSAQPYVKVTVEERVGGVVRLSWSRLYSGSEPDFYHAATLPGDGSLVRARVGNASPYWVYVQRVINPGPGSDFSPWSSFAQTSGSSGIAVASQGATVLLFFVDSDGLTVKCAQSDNYGASFGSPSAILTAAGAVGWLAADFNGSGVAALFYSVGGMVYVVKRTGGSWGAPTAWTNSLAAVNGLACAYAADWNVAISGQDAAGSRKLWTCVYGDGYSGGSGDWSSLMELTAASPNSNLEFYCPSLAYPDVFRLFFVEKYSGSDAYSRPFWSHSLPTAEFISNLWREPVPFDLSSTYGVALAYADSYAWLSSPSGVWRASLSPAALELTFDVLALEAESRPLSGRATVRLRNDDGRFNNPGAGQYAALQPGSQLQVSPGYVTPAGQEFSAGPAFWLEGWEHLSRDRQAVLVLYAGDGWRLLEKWRARRQFSWSTGSKNVFQLISFVLARAGLEFSALSSSSTISNLYPAFTIHPAESGADAVRRLLAMVPDVLFFRGNTAYSLNPQASDTSVYSYGSAGTGHAVLGGRYVQASGANHVQVYGNGVMSEGFSWAGVSLAYDSLLQVHDLNLDTPARVQARVARELRHREMETLGGEITVPANCGQELYDVIDVTDSPAGLSQAKRRVLGLSLVYSVEKRAAVYQHRLTLGGA
ncbi:MAG: hypothetical protein HY671_15240 [Chloroflexi bacterium]|nr:hypothetical protein [Chloroflexota bacterium]